MNASRFDLGELISVLHGIARVEVDPRVLDPEAPEFALQVTFSRERLDSAGVSRMDGTLLTPTWLFEGILEQLQDWLRQRLREEAWMRGEQRFGAGIDQVMGFLTERMKDAKTRLNRSPSNLRESVELKLWSNAILRLQELKERRAASGLQDTWSAMRDRATSAWREEEVEGLKREEKQRRQREKANGPDVGMQDDPGWFRGAFEGLFNKPGSFAGFKSSHQAQYAAERWANVLDVDVTASFDTVQKAVRRLRRKYHPDKPENNTPENANRIKEINNAWEVYKRVRGLSGE